MHFFARFQAISDNDKAALVRKLLESSTPDFDFFYFVGLSVFMAALGLLLDSPSIVIGSMLIAPIMYPILGVSLGLVMSRGDVLRRSFSTLIQALIIGLVVSFIVGFFFGAEGSTTSTEIIARTHPNLLYMFVAIVAGAAVSFALAQPAWSETLPGIAISVALIPPLAALGIGLASFNGDVIKGTTVLLFLNVIGIIGAAAVTFMMMNLYQKQHIAESTIKREDERLKEEEAVIEEIAKKNGENNGENNEHEKDPS